MFQLKKTDEEDRKPVEIEPIIVGLVLSLIEHVEIYD